MCRLSREVRAVSSFVFSTVCVDLITLSVMVRFKVFFLFSNTTHSTEHDLESLASRRIHRCSKPYPPTRRKIHPQRSQTKHSRQFRWLWVGCRWVFPHRSTSLCRFFSFFLTRFSVKYFSPVTNVAIVRVARDRYSIAWGGITLLKEIGTEKIIPHVVHVSGTLILSIYFLILTLGRNHQTCPTGCYRAQ